MGIRFKEFFIHRLLKIIFILIFLRPANPEFIFLYLHIGLPQDEVKLRN